MIRADFIERLRQQADIVQITGELIKIRKAGSQYKACCPFHEEKSPSFNINPKTQKYKCFGCGQSGDVFRFVMNFKRFTFTEAVEYIAGRCHQVVEYESPDYKPSRFRDIQL
ncbi:CHC2 zinc finger domain-containing protein [Arsenicibacter rosenii]|uniref:Zinc finger CHC2-type domain-containing protein n=1 Tax=Arsenicibacter rosenii TaxID=1750698 RepID=A0A1S2VNM9_9BACT|nr:CHC2 zinc finger domain-containing protein [Arsenicibacter rosenii]OIN59776.1 hypothetical protein BLX24_07930 [Arsenicibacter rosenii]